jgi:hypothetical protein
MADTKISALPASTTPLAGTEVLPIVQGGATVKVSVANLTAGRAVSATQMTLTTGNLIVANGQGIDFSATPGTGTSELLADYEEGTWTPTVVGATSAGTATYQTQIGYYTKIGRQVFCYIDLYWLTSTGVGVALVNGLPFTSSSFDNNLFILFDGNATVVNSSASKVNPSSTQIRCYQYVVGAAGTVFGQFNYFV